MAEIKKVDFSKFLQNQDFTLHGLLIAEIEKLTDPKITDLRTAYKNKYAKFDEVLKVGGKSPHSQKLADLDKLQDNMYTGLAAQNRAMLISLRPGEGRDSLPGGYYPEKIWKSLPFALSSGRCRDQKPVAGSGSIRQ